jgi:hypothetical protein
MTPNKGSPCTAFKTGISIAYHSVNSEHGYFKRRTK